MSAVISECGKYRYSLDRDVAETGAVFAYFGVNCSTADASIDDQTVIKWIGFTKRNGGRRFIVGNPFAFRSTDVKNLATCPDPVGPDNQRHILEIIAAADVIVPCWGSRAKVPEKLRPHFDALKMLIFASGKPVKIFGLTKSGDPKHPLMLGYDTPLIPWRTP